MSQTRLSRYVVSNPDVCSGEPVIVGTRTTVQMVAKLWRMGIRPEQIPSRVQNLTLAQVLDALSFYMDHQAEINEYIERSYTIDEIVHRPTTLV